MRTAQIGPDLRLELFNPDEAKGYQTFILPKIIIIIIIIIIMMMMMIIIIIIISE